MSRLAEIYNTQKSKGGGLGSTLMERAKEKFDPRQKLDQSGLLVSMFPSLKKYTSEGSLGKNTTNRLSPDVISESSGLLKVIHVNTALTARNTMVLPMISRDMNITRQSLVKIVKLLGGQQKNKADMFFKDVAEREKEFESIRASTTERLYPTKTAPTQEEKKEGFFSKFLSLLIKGGLITGLMFGVKKYFEGGDFKKTVDSIFSSVFSWMVETIKEHWQYVLAGLALAFPLTTLKLIGSALSSLWSVLKGMNLPNIPTQTPQPSTSGQQRPTPPQPGTPTSGQQPSSSGGTRTGPVVITPSGGNAPKPVPMPPTPSTSASSAPKPTTPVSGVPKKQTAALLKAPVQSAAAQKTIEKATTTGAKKILQNFFTKGVSFLAASPVLNGFAAAYGLYQIIDALSPDEQQRVIDATAALASIQEDIDDVQKSQISNSQKQKAIAGLTKTSQLYSEQLKRLGANVPTLSNTSTVTPAEISAVPSTAPTQQTGMPEVAKSKAQKISSDGISLLNRVLDDQGITDQSIRDRIFSLAYKESSMVPTIEGPLINDKKSMHYGDRAQGLLQIMPKTAKGMGFSESSLKDPYVSATAGVKYFMSNYERFNGDLDKATVAHHAGPGKVNAIMSGSRSVDVATGISTMDYLNQIKNIKIDPTANIANITNTKKPVGPIVEASKALPTANAAPAEEDKTSILGKAFEFLSPITFLNNLTKNFTDDTVLANTMNEMGLGKNSRLMQYLNNLNTDLFVKDQNGELGVDIIGRRLREEGMKDVDAVMNLVGKLMQSETGKEIDISSLVNDFQKREVPQPVMPAPVMPAPVAVAPQNLAPTLPASPVDRVLTEHLYKEVSSLFPLTTRPF